MTDKEKLIKIKSLADKMYDAAFNLTTDASLLRKAMDEYHQFIINEYHKEEPVSEELEEAAEGYAVTDEVLPNGKVMINFQVEKAFKAGAKWQKQVFEKNRLAACDRATKEEIEREQDFLDKVLIGEQRQPTFSDAIEYGIKWQKQAEEDLALTWEDIKTVDKLLNQCVDYSNPYQEVLKRFKAMKDV